MSEWGRKISFLETPSIDSLLQKGNTPLEVKISSRVIPKERAEQGYVQTNQMIRPVMIFDEVALGLRLRGVAEEGDIQKGVSIKRSYEQVNGRFLRPLVWAKETNLTIASILVLRTKKFLVLRTRADSRSGPALCWHHGISDSLPEKGHTVSWLPMICNWCWIILIVHLWYQTVKF